MSVNEISPERFKDLAYSFKDLEAQQLNVNRKILRILRELESRIVKLEPKSPNSKSVVGKTS